MEVRLLLEMKEYTAYIKGKSWKNSLLIYKEKLIEIIILNFSTKELFFET